MEVVMLQVVWTLSINYDSLACFDDGSCVSPI